MVWTSVRFGKVEFGQVRFGRVWFGMDPVRCGFRFGVDLGAVPHGSVRFGWARYG